MSSLRRVARVEARLAPCRWLWAEGHPDLIAANWARRQSVRPELFNGRILMVAKATIRGDAMAVRFFQTDYANLLAWIEHGFPGEPVWNGFAMGALRGRDGGYVLGRMADHTANAGRLYFPCGTPDLSDVTGSGAVDLAGSLTREIGEETGLATGDYAVEPGWIVVRDGGLMAFMRVAQLRATAEAACGRIRAHIAAEANPELAGVEIAAGSGDFDEATMPGVVPIFLRDAFAREAAAAEAAPAGL